MSDVVPGISSSAGGPSADRTQVGISGGIDRQRIGRIFSCLFILLLGNAAGASEPPVADAPSRDSSPEPSRALRTGKRGMGAWSTPVRPKWVCAKEVGMRGKEHDHPALPLLALPNHLMTIPEVAAY